MADNVRHLFGGNISDWVFSADENGAIRVSGGAVLRFYSERSGGVEYTNFTSDQAGDTVLPQVVSETGADAGFVLGDFPLFYGPVGVTWMWASADDGPRKLIVACDLPENVSRAIMSTLLTTKGDLIVASGLSTADRLPVGADGRVLVADSTQTLGVRWATAGGAAASSLTGVLWVAALDAPAEFADAPYQCDGVADELQINTALANAYGLPVCLSPGTFVTAGPIQLLGSNSASVPRACTLRGSGTYSTVVNVGSGVSAGIVFGNVVSPHVSDLTVSVRGATHGFYATRSTATSAEGQSFVRGSIKNCLVAGPGDGTHTGWAISFGSAIGFVVENFDAVGCGNGARIVNEASSFVSGDVLFLRCSMELVGPNSIGYHVTTTGGGLTRLTFETCHTVVTGSSTNTMGWKFDGTGRVWSVRVRNSLVLNYGVSVSIGSTCDDISMDLGQASHGGGTFAAVAGFNCEIAVGQLYVGGGTVAAIVDTNTTAKPNRYLLNTFAEPGTTVGLTLGSGVLIRSTADGTGTIAPILRKRQLAGRAFTATRTATLAVLADAVTLYNDTAIDLVLRAVRVSIRTAYTAGSTIFDVNLGGNTLFAAQANRPTIAAAARTTGRITSDVSGVLWTAGTALTVDVDQIGTAGTGTDITVQVETF